MSSSISSSEPGKPSRAVRIASFTTAFVLAWGVAWAAVWLLDRTGIWERLRISPSMAGKWDPAERDPISRDYQRPGVPTGRHFHRRAGPFVSEGRILADGARHRGYAYAPYDAEPPIRVEYGRLGYRSEFAAEPGGTAVLGSSYVEAAFAAAEDTIPGWLRSDHGIPAANFGTAYTGGEAVLSSLDRFVMPTQPAHIVWLFAERADFGQLVEEHRRITAEPGPKLGSLLDTLRSASAGFLVSALRSADDTGRYWRSRLGGATGPERRQPLPKQRFRIGTRALAIQLTAVPSWPIVTEARPLLASVLARMQRVAAAGGADLSVAYVPVRARTLRGLGVPPTRLIPLPRFAVGVESECEKLGIPFTDTTEPLRIALRQDVLVINPVWDTHLNAAGMRVVASSIAEMLNAPEN